MPGTSEVDFWELDGQYLSQVAGEAITLGLVVAVGATDGNVIVGTASHTKPLGVAIAGYRTSRTATDNAVASGSKVTVATRGVVNLTSASAITRGEYVECGAAGTVQTATLSAVADWSKVLGMALSTVTAGSLTVKVKLMRG